MKKIILQENVGSFAENKDVAREIREQLIKPALAAGVDVVLDFEGVSMATQSFIHALISDPIRIYGANVLDQIEFKNCNESPDGHLKIPHPWPGQNPPP
jgi:hypothetical protein